MYRHLNSGKATFLQKYSHLRSSELRIEFAELASLHVEQYAALSMSHDNACKGSELKRVVPRVPFKSILCHDHLSPKRIKISSAFSNRYQSRKFHISAALAAVVVLESGSRATSELKIPSGKDIRSRLRSWEASQDEHYLEPPQNDLLSKGLEIGGPSLPLEDPDDSNVYDDGMEDEPDNELGNDLLFSKDELLEFDDRRSFLVRGDMSVLQAGARLELAVCVQRVESEYYFLTQAGKLVSRPRRRFPFVVSKLFTAEEVKPLLKFQPNPKDIRDVVPRRVSGPILKKMQDFQNEADRFYLDNSNRLDRSHDLVASVEKTETKTLSLLEIATEVVPRHSELYSQAELFALYHTLISDGVGFQSLSDCRGEHPLFLITSRKLRETIEHVCDEVRRVALKNRSFADLKYDLPLGSFISKVRRRIDHHRKFRHITPYGMLGPLNAADDLVKDTVPSFHDQNFNATDLKYIEFMKAYTNLRSLRATSQESAIASLILRATDRYPEHVLNQSTAWCFLQEINIYSSFDTPAVLMLQNSFQNEASSKTSFTPETLQSQDAFSGQRRDWQNTPVYCIDDASAREIDDGISIESASQYGEFWVHIHTANPTSRLPAQSDIILEARDKVSSIYFPEKIFDMLPRDMVQEHFSLAADRPALTYSARIDNTGEIQEYSITPGMLRNVIYIAPDTVDQIVEGHRSAPVIGGSVRIEGAVSPSDPINSDKSRPLATEETLSKNDKDNLKLLNTIAVARERRSGKRGGLTPEMHGKLFGKDFRAATPKVTRPQEKASPHKRKDLMENDPGLELTLALTDSLPDRQGSSLVTNLMLLGGEIAARWCHDRNIPVPFRVSQRNDDFVDPADYYRQEIRPLFQKSEEVPTSVLENYLSLLGPIRLSSIPGPHMTLGLDMFARSTSPLRRFSDLLLQYQVQAALLEEHRIGESLIGSTDMAYLPFSKEDVDSYLPHESIRTSDYRLAQHMASQFWTIQLLVRAWKFGEAELPKTLTYRVVARGSDYVRGQIGLLGLDRVRMRAPEWMNIDDIKTNDVFEVELEDMNAFERLVYVKPLRLVEKRKSDELQAAN